MLKNNIIAIDDLLKIWEKYDSRDAVLTECIHQKLKTSTLTYEDELKIGVICLSHAYKTLNVMKAAQKIQRRDDIERLEAQLDAIKDEDEVENEY